MDMNTITCTVQNTTHAPTMRVITRSIDRSNPNNIIITYNGISVVVNKRAWNMLSLNAPVERIVSM